MNHKQRSALHSLFARPISSDIDPRLACSTMKAAGIGPARDFPMEAAAT